MIKKIFYICTVLFLIIYIFIPDISNSNQEVEDFTHQKLIMNDENNTSISKKNSKKTNKIKSKIEWRNFKSITLLDYFKNKFGLP